MPRIPKGKTLFIIVLLALILVLLLVTISSSKKGVPSPSPAPSVVTFNYPTAQPQQFSNDQLNQFGTLAVTSKPDKVAVTIDTEEVQSPDFYAPTNQTPFVIKQIPVGKHTLRARKDGYLILTQQVNIEANEISQVDLKLTPNPEVANLEKAKQQMPVTTDEYLIEYLTNIQIIQVIIRKEPFQENKQKAIDWFKGQGVNNPEEAGVLFYPALGVKP